MSLAADADVSDSVDLFGKVASDLQDDIIIVDDEIAGTLKYIDDYSSAYGPGMDSGNYLVLHLSTGDVSGATIKAKLFGGTTGWVTVDPSDNLLITRVTDKNSQTLVVVAMKDGYLQASRHYSLEGLTLEPAT